MYISHGDEYVCGALCAYCTRVARIYGRGCKYFRDGFAPVRMSTLSRKRSICRDWSRDDGKFPVSVLRFAVTHQCSVTLPCFANLREVSQNEPDAIERRGNYRTSDPKTQRFRPTPRRQADWKQLGRRGPYRRRQWRGPGPGRALVVVAGRQIGAVARKDREQRKKEKRSRGRPAKFQARRRIPDAVASRVLPEDAAGRRQSCAGGVQFPRDERQRFFTVCLGAGQVFCSTVCCFNS